MADRPEEFDAQDVAETFDEDNLDADPRRRRLGDEEMNADTLPSVYDVTSRDGDGNDDDALIAEDLDDDEIVALSRDAADVDDYEDEGEERTDAVRGPVGLDGVDVRAGGGRDFERNRGGTAGGGGEEVGLTYVGDVSGRAGAHSAAQRYESRSLDDDDIDALGYGRQDRAPEKVQGQVQGQAQAPDQGQAQGREDRGGDQREGRPDGGRGVTGLPTQGVSSSHHDAPAERRLDEGVEETFPASDPVSVKHVS